MRLPRAIASPRRMPIRSASRDVPAVVDEEATARICEVAGLEEAEHHCKEGEGAEVVVGSGDQGEYLDLGLDAGPKLHEHVDPVMLGEVRRRASGCAWKTNPLAT